MANLTIMYWKYSMCTFGSPKKVGKGVGVLSCLGQKGCRCISHEKPFIPMGVKRFEHHHD
jgi:hypothetical protein